VAFELKENVLEKGVQSMRAAYYRLKEKDSTKYDFSAGAVSNVAEWLFDRGHKSTSIEVLEFCIALEPKEFRWYEYIGDVYNESGKKDQAREWYEKASAIAPDDKDLHGKLETLKQ
jgi:tetratricopeptide (TPR) repeat protein